MNAECYSSQPVWVGEVVVTRLNPIRNITQVWDRSGAMIASVDALETALLQDRVAELEQEVDRLNNSLESNRMNQRRLLDQRDEAVVYLSSFVEEAKLHVTNVGAKKKCLLCGLYNGLHDLACYMNTDNLIAGRVDRPASDGVVSEG